MTHLLKQTSSIYSLVIRHESEITIAQLLEDEVCSAVVRYVDQWKLRYLTVPVGNLNHVQMLLERFQDLFSINFSLRIRSVTSEEVITYVKKFRHDCSIQGQCHSVSVWLGK